MDEKKVLDMEDLMIDYGEMTSFDFNSLSFKEMQDCRILQEPTMHSRLFRLNTANSIWSICSNPLLRRRINYY